MGRLGGGGRVLLSLRGELPFFDTFILKERLAILSLFSILGIRRNLGNDMGRTRAGIKSSPWSTVLSVLCFL